MKSPKKLWEIVYRIQLRYKKGDWKSGKQIFREKLKMVRSKVMDQTLNFAIFLIFIVKIFIKYFEQNRNELIIVFNNFLVFFNQIYNLCQVYASALTIATSSIGKSFCFNVQLN